MQLLAVQKQLLKSEKKYKLIPLIKINVFRVDFSVINIGSSSENGMM